MFKQVHHLGFSVFNLENVMNKVEEYYKLKRGEIIDIEEREMKAVLYKIGETRIEYLAPTSKSSPLTKFLEINGEGLHHIAYLVDSIDKAKRMLPEGSLEPTRESNVGNWIIADFKPEYDLLGIKSQIIEER